MKKLCLDLGTTTGWATNSTPVASGTISFKLGRFEGGGMRYLRFRVWLEEIRTLHPFESVFFEEVRGHRGTDAAHIYGGLLATLTAWCEAEKIPYLGVAVGTIKKTLTGKGNADKKLMIAAVKALGYQPADDNEADALAILHAVEGGR